MDKLGSNLPIWWVKMENKNHKKLKKKISITSLMFFPKDHPYFWMASSLSYLVGGPPPKTASWSRLADQCPNTHVEATCNKIPAEMLRAGEGPAFTFAPTLASSKLDGMIFREGLGDGGPADKSSLIQVVPGYLPAL